jgi:hypothetical protein
MNTPETNWIRECREQWLSSPVEIRKSPQFRLAFCQSWTANSAASRARAFQTAWFLARGEWYRSDPQLLKSFREFMRDSALEAIAHARHYVLEGERQKKAEEERRAKAYQSWELVNN